MVRFNTADDFYETMAAGGNAMRLEDIKGIGPKTANKINNVREIQGTDDIKEMSADELSDKAGISRSRASKAIKGLGGNPGVSKRNRSTGTVSAAGIQQAQGDFMVGFSELDKARARNDAMSRSETAVRVDERRRAPVTTDYEQWKNAPGEWDFPGVDTPTQDPNLLPKDVMAGDPQTADFDAVDERRQERQAQAYPRKTDAASGKEDYILETGEDRIPASEMAASGMGVSDADTFTSALDVPASPEEVFEGVGLGSPSAPGGQAYNALEGGPVETDRTDQEQKPPEQALEAQSRGEIGDIPEPTTIDIATGNTTGSDDTTSTTGKPEFREPNIGMYNVGDQFTVTYESNRAGTGLVTQEGTVVEKFDNRLQIDTGGGDYYEISKTGKVVSISDNFNRSLVGWAVYQ